VGEGRTRRAIALDHGQRRIGVAATDALGLMAHPLGVIDNDGDASVAAAVREIAAEREAEVLVIGIPINIDGSSGPAAKAARAFADRLAQSTGLPVETVDERLTTLDAEDRLKQAGMRDWRERKRKRDQAAAALILERWLDRERREAARRAAREGG
jgi:putative Holliday junction resolvase